MGFRFTVLIGIVIVLASLASRGRTQANLQPDDLQWPKVERQMRPWTRWWWLGSAVDKPNLTRLLETYHEAGLGGVEITPIYGVKGQEARDVPYLSARWVELLRHTIHEAGRLDMGVDMPTGTGWPFGGPQVTDEDAEDRLVIQTERIAAGKPFELAPGKTHWQALTAVSDAGQNVSLLTKVDVSGSLHWTPPDERAWTVYKVTQKWSGRDVKRAAPGGEGKCINPFSRVSLAHYLKRFDSALADLPGGALRAHFHDSFEYNADWMLTFFEEFRVRRGYDLREHLAEFTGAAGADGEARVRTDYRETIGDLLRENFTAAWTDWAHTRGSLSRNQAHGSPGNLLDLYGTADIPETEVFHSIGDPRISKFASSAAHVLGKPLVSSETCTWQDEHFNETLGRSRWIVDRLMAAGINHIFYHGTAYSPADAPWPGWLFYASTHFEPQNTLWHDFPTLNTYIARCQSLLQAGKPDNDVLVYWPLHDLWQHQPRVFGLAIDGKWLESEPIGNTAQVLLNAGYQYDYVSDDQLKLAQVRLPEKAVGTQSGRIEMPGGAYRVILIPPCKFMPLATLETLLALAKNGAAVLFEGRLPEDVPGLADLEHRRAAFHRRLDTIVFTEANKILGGLRKARVGKGAVWVGSSAPELLNASASITGVQRETICDTPGVMCLRRRVSAGFTYFIVNQSDQPIDGWVRLACDAGSVILMDAMSGRTGVAKARQVRPATGSELPATEFYVQLPRGASIMARAIKNSPPTGSGWPYLTAAGSPVPLHGAWSVQFLSGGPRLPDPFSLTQLASWTMGSDPERQRFAGTARYTLLFDAPSSAGENWVLDLGDVRESARVRLNGSEVGTLLASPWQVRLPALKPQGNRLEVDVTNAPANRIRDMDRRGVEWKIFREINFVNQSYKPFDASNWPIRDSGLLGPVRLIPMKAMRF